MKRLIALFLFLGATTAIAEPVQYRTKNVATRICGTIYNVTTGVRIGAAPTSLDCEYAVVTDGANESAFTDLSTAEATVGTLGQFCVPITASEINIDGDLRIYCSATNTNAAGFEVTLTTRGNKIETNGVVETSIAARGTAQAATSTTLQLAASETFANNELNYTTEVCIVSATTGAGQCRCVTGYVGSTDTATVQTWTTTPTGTITYSLKSNNACQMFNTAVAKYNFMNDAGVALSACPSATATKKEQLQYLFEALINRSTQTSTTRTLRNAGNSGNLCTETITPGATFVKGQAS